MNVALTAVTVVSLAVIALVLVAVLRLEHPWLQPWAIGRAAVQLGAISLVLGGVIESRFWVAVFLTVMITAATWIVGRRLRPPIAKVAAIALTIAVASAVPVAVIFATQALDLSARYLLAVGGIVIGGTMTTATLMGRALGAGYFSGRDEIEGWLALGATPRQAVRRQVRAAASTALIPATDQTRTTGIVTLPGAFVGAVFGGASPYEAAQFQILVLAAILAAGAITVTCLTWIFGAPPTLPVEEPVFG